MSDKKGCYNFFQNRDCEYFPCHKIEDDKNFNCLFCYCPLYALGEGCGGNYTYENPARIKDCSHCTFPHQRENYQKVIDKTKNLIDLAKEKPEEI